MTSDFVLGAIAGLLLAQTVALLAVLYKTRSRDRQTVSRRLGMLTTYAPVKGGRS